MNYEVKKDEPQRCGYAKKRKRGRGSAFTKAKADEGGD